MVLKVHLTELGTLLPPAELNAILELEDEVVGQGAIAKVFAASLDGRPYVAKLAHANKSELVVAEFAFMQELSRQVLDQRRHERNSRSPQYSALPRVGLAYAEDGQAALIMPRYQRRLSDHIRETLLAQSNSSLEMEILSLEAAIDYCYIMEAVRQQEKSSVDRKAKDFYVLLDETSPEYAIIDWNVLSDALPAFFTNEILTFGRIWYELLLNQTPHGRLNPFDDTIWQAHDFQIDGGVMSLGLRLIIMACLEAPPDERFTGDQEYSNHGALREALVTWLNLLRTNTVTLLSTTTKRENFYSKLPRSFQPPLGGKADIAIFKDLIWRSNLNNQSGEISLQWENRQKALEEATQDFVMAGGENRYVSIINDAFASRNTEKARDAIASFLIEIAGTVELDLVAHLELVAKAPLALGQENAQLIDWQHLQRWQIIVNLYQMLARVDMRADTNFRGSLVDSLGAKLHQNPLDDNDFLINGLRLAWEEAFNKVKGLESRLDKANFAQAEQAMQQIKYEIELRAETLAYRQNNPIFDRRNLLSELSSKIAELYRPEASVGIPQYLKIPQVLAYHTKVEWLVKPDNTNESLLTKMLGNYETAMRRVSDYVREGAYVAALSYIETTSQLILNPRTFQRWRAEIKPWHTYCQLLDKAQRGMLNRQHFLDEITPLYEYKEIAGDPELVKRLDQLLSAELHAVAALLNDVLRKPIRQERISEAISLYLPIFEDERHQSILKAHASKLPDYPQAIQRIKEVSKLFAALTIARESYRVASNENQRYLANEKSFLSLIQTVLSEGIDMSDYLKKDDASMEDWKNLIGNALKAISNAQTFVEGKLETEIAALTTTFQAEQAKLAQLQSKLLAQIEPLNEQVKNVREASLQTGKELEDIGEMLPKLRQSLETAITTGDETIDKKLDSNFQDLERKIESSETLLKRLEKSDQLTKFANKAFRDLLIAYLEGLTFESIQGITEVGMLLTLADELLQYLRACPIPVYDQAVHKKWSEKVSFIKQQMESLLAKNKNRQPIDSLGILLAEAQKHFEAYEAYIKMEANNG